MTQREHDALQRFINRSQTHRKNADAQYNELQEMCRQLGLPVYCCAKTNYDQLKDHQEPYTENGCNTTYGRRAEILHHCYIQELAKKDTIEQLGSVLAGYGFWK